MEYMVALLDIFKYEEEMPTSESWIHSDERKMHRGSVLELIIYRTKHHKILGYSLLCIKYQI